MTNFVSAEKKIDIKIFIWMLDKFISSANKRFYALKLFHFNFELIFLLNG